MNFPNILKHLRTQRGINQSELATALGVSRSAIGMYESGKREPDFETMEAIADYFNVDMNYLHGLQSQQHIPHTLFPSPIITDNYVTFPVLGDIAAGYDSIAVEDWDGDVIEIPQSQLKGRDQSEFFVLRVKGDSMYPTYHDGDKVLILKQTTLSFSGQVGAILYEDENATLKKVEFVPGEDWLRLVPINANYPPKRIEGEELEHCRVIGIPRLLIREIED
ncbi:MAG: LexA family transcriptional regulator [Lachnospiraceae bacterium]|nr:LexA family transcriptional regulator [Lachnospiraceae bacterium]